jgi:prepilin-type N-terminal cleavage/methylation domain-containing protein
MDMTSRKRQTLRGFTLVELLVVITIITILAALITVAAVGALRSANRARIKAEINEIAGGFDEYKNKTTAYPPNAQTDGNGVLLEADILNDMRRHLKQLAPRSQESDDLARILVGLTASTSADYPRPLEGGISAAEAVVFWLGGFSADPKFPISGNGGPSYPIASPGNAANAAQDPIESRKWVYPFDVTRLGPRGTDGYFNGRFIEYKSPIGWRRINFWTYTPAKSDQPFVYFDTSRHPAASFKGSTTGTVYGYFDPPAATYTTPDPGDLHTVCAFKKLAETQGPTPGSVPVIQFINPDKFQVFHCGIDNTWGATDFGKMLLPRTAGAPNTVASFPLLFPAGPFVGDFADTEVNFAVETTIEDAQK